MKKLLFLNVLFFISIKVFCQDIFPSPNASSFGVFNDYPKSSFVGQPSVGVPIHNLNVYGFDLSLSLNYNSNLIKPYVYPSWVGRGWNLSVGGLITRVINDKPDDMNWYNGSHYYVTKVEDGVGYFYNHGYLSASNWSDGERMKSAAGDIMNYKDNNLPYLDNILDYSPDEFSFNVGELSGVFYLSDDGKWKVRCNRSVKVEISNADFSYVPTPPFISILGPDYNIYFPDKRRLERITLTDDAGRKFIFGGEQNSFEGDGSVIKSWYLTKIIFPNGHIAQFRYESGNKVGQLVPISTEFSIDNPLAHQGTNYAGVSSSTVFLKSIITENQNINFYRFEETNKLPRLDSVVVVNNYDKSTLKKINFLFENSPMDSLSLKRVNFVDKYNGILSYYNFKYNGGKFNSKDTDHWGYYTSRPFDPTTRASFIASKEADTSSCRIGLLSQIHYPTGGYTEYTWEPNSYSKVLLKENDLGVEEMGSVQYAGGARIKKISHYTPEGKASSKIYYYINNFDPLNKNGSSGILYSKPFYVYGNKYNYFFSSSIPLFESNTGGHVTYSEVAEVDEDGGYAITKFSNYDNGINHEYLDEKYVNYTFYTANANTIDYYNSNQHERGYPISYKVLSKNRILLNEKIFQYERLNKSSEFVRSYVIKHGLAPAVDDLPEVRYYSVWATRIYTNSFLLSQEKDIMYDLEGLNPVETTKSYSYDLNSRLPRIETIVDSKGQSRKNSFKYPYDFSSGVYQEMASKNIIRPVIEQNETLDDKPTAFTRTNYNKFNSNNLFLPQSVESNIGNNAIETRQLFNKYDLKGNLLEQQPPFGMKTSYLWGYNNQYPVAKVTNAEQGRGIILTDHYDYRRTTKYYTLPSRPGEYVINFTSGQAGDLKITLPGALGEDWAATYNIDYNAYSGGLISRRSYGGIPSPDPWSHYYGPDINPDYYVISKTFYGLPAGDHTIRVYPDSRGTSSGSSTDQLNIEYTEKYVTSTDTTITGKDEFFYNGFNEGHMEEVSYFPFAGQGHYIGHYTVPFKIEGSRKYKIDYRYFKDQKWQYVNKDYYNDMILEDGTSIDEVRVYPVDAAMATYTYEPLVGMTSQTDPKGQTIFYEYDNAHQLKIVRDQNGNIIKNYNYHYQGQAGTVPITYSSVEMKQNYKRNNCNISLGEIGNEISYIVPAGKYSSAISQTDANLKAYNEMVTNGQDYANSHAECGAYVIVSVYNPVNETFFLDFQSGPQGNVQSTYYEVPPGDGNTPHILYIPRKNYRSVSMFVANQYDNKVEFNIRSSGSPFFETYYSPVSYSIADYLELEDSYTINR